MHHPNGPDLSIDYALDSASMSELRGKEKGHSQQEREVGTLSFVPQISCYRRVRQWVSHTVYLQVAVTQAERKHNYILCLLRHTFLESRVTEQHTCILC
jgi:hypothetical protein